MNRLPDRDDPATVARGRRRALASLCLAVAAGILVLPDSAVAADDAIDDVMMQVVEDPDADERQYVDEIELPRAVDRARDPEAANGRPASGKTPGREAAKAARDSSEAARERGRGDRGRSGRRDTAGERGPPLDTPNN